MANEIDPSVIAQQYESLHSEVKIIAGTVADLAGVIAKQAKEKEELTAKAKAEMAEQKMFKRFLKMLKSEGLISKEGKFPTAEGQESKTPTKDPKGQQALIQGQEEGYKAPETEEEEEEPFVKPDEAGVAKAEDEEEEMDEMTKLRKENESLKKEMETVKASIPAEIKKAVDMKMQEKNWKPVAKAPAKLVAAASTKVEPITKSTEKPLTREEVIQKMLKMPLGEVNDLHMKYQAGELKGLEGLI